MKTTSLAIAGGTPAFAHRPPRYPQFSEESLARLTEVLRTGPTQGLSKQNAVVGEFEDAMAEFHEVPHCLSASSGHGALQSALIGLEVTGGDEVVTSPYSWGASVSCILHNGAVPVFSDVDPETGLLDPDQVESSITSRTRAILVPHLYGQPTDMTRIMAVANRHDLAVIEDGSQAHGAKHDGRRLGSFGHASGYSINGVKPLATAEGGYMVTRDPDVYWKATISAQHAGRGELVGRASEPGFPDGLRPLIDSLVYTYRPNIASLVLALDQLTHVDELNDTRRENAMSFAEKLAASDLFRVPEYREADTPVFHMVTLNVAPRYVLQKPAILAALQAEGVPAVTYVEKGLHKSPRLSPAYAGPRVMWTEAIKASGTDPTKMDLPGCDAKVAGSIEIPWNYVERNEELVEDLATAFLKVEEDLQLD